MFNMNPHEPIIKWYNYLYVYIMGYPVLFHPSSLFLSNPRSQWITALSCPHLQRSLCYKWHLTHSLWPNLSWQKIFLYYISNNMMWLVKWTMFHNFTLFSSGNDSCLLLLILTRAGIFCFEYQNSFVTFVWSALVAYQWHMFQGITAMKSTKG